MLGAGASAGPAAECNAGSCAAVVLGGAADGGSSTTLPDDGTSMGREISSPSLVLFPLLGVPRNMRAARRRVSSQPRLIGRVDD